MSEEVHFWWSVTDNPRFVSLFPSQFCLRSSSQVALLCVFTGVFTFSRPLFVLVVQLNVFTEGPCQHTNTHTHTQYNPPPTPGLPEQNPVHTMRSNNGPLSPVKELLVELRGTEKTRHVLFLRMTETVLILLEFIWKHQNLTWTLLINPGFSYYSTTRFKKVNI